MASNNPESILSLPCFDVLKKITDLNTKYIDKTADYFAWFDRFLETATEQLQQGSDVDVLPKTPSTVRVRRQRRQPPRFSPGPIQGTSRITRSRAALSSVSSSDTDAGDAKFSQGGNDSKKNVPSNNKQRTKRKGKRRSSSESETASVTFDVAETPDTIVKTKPVRVLNVKKALVEQRNEGMMVSLGSPSVISGKKNHLLSESEESIEEAVEAIEAEIEDQVTPKVDVGKTKQGSVPSTPETVKANVATHSGGPQPSKRPRIGPVVETTGTCDQDPNSLRAKQIVKVGGGEHFEVQKNANTETAYAQISAKKAMAMSPAFVFTKVASAPIAAKKSGILPSAKPARVSPVPKVVIHAPSLDGEGAAADNTANVSMELDSLDVSGSTSSQSSRRHSKTRLNSSVSSVSHKSIRKSNGPTVASSAKLRAAALLLVDMTLSDQETIVSSGGGKRSRDLDAEQPAVAGCSAAAAVVVKEEEMEDDDDEEEVEADDEEEEDSEEEAGEDAEVAVKEEAAPIAAAVDEKGIMEESILPAANLTLAMGLDAEPPKAPDSAKPVRMTRTKQRVIDQKKAATITKELSVVLTNVKSVKTPPSVANNLQTAKLTPKTPPRRQPMTAVQETAQLKPQTPLGANRATRSKMRQQKEKQERLQQQGTSSFVSKSPRMTPVTPTPSEKSGSRTPSTLKAKQTTTGKSSFVNSQQAKRVMPKVSLMNSMIKNRPTPSNLVKCVGGGKATFIRTPQKEREKALLAAQEQQKREEAMRVKELRQQEAVAKRDEMLRARMEEQKRKIDERAKQAQLARQQRDQELEAARKRKLEAKEAATHSALKEAEEQKRKQKAWREAEDRRRQEEEKQRQIAEEQQAKLRKQKEEEAKRQKQEAARRKEQEKQQREREELKRVQDKEAQRQHQQSSANNKEPLLKKVLHNQLRSTYSMASTSAMSDNSESYEMTPQRVAKPATDSNYDISDLKSDDDTDEEENPRKRIPYWATGAPLKAQLTMQQYNPPDLMTIFPPILNPDLTKIFTVMRKRFNNRTSSAQWSSPIMKDHNLDMSLSYKRLTSPD